MGLARLAEHLGTSRCLGCARLGSLACESCRAGIVPAADVRTVPHIDRAIAAWEYDDVARSLVLALKLRGRREAARHLATGIAQQIWATGWDVDALVWIPGHRDDIRRRGFDHARAMAHDLSALLGIPSVPALARTGHRMDQAGLGAVQRKANLAGAFTASNVPPRVGVVDDVLTTGATLSEAGRALRAAGASRVEGVVGCAVA